MENIMTTRPSGPILAVLAAGMGSRYGGLKQMDAFGAAGETLLDYSVFDARRAGFAKTVFIIRHDIEAAFAEKVLSRMACGMPFELAFQERGACLPAGYAARAEAAGRTKPWGTAHAVLCAAPFLDAPFCVINADDFYGKAAFDAMGRFLAAENLADGALVPYKLAKTLSARGGVARGVCALEDGFLRSIEELKSIARRDGGRVADRGEGGAERPLADDAPVSMNFWGFPPAVLPHLKTYFERFLAGLAPDDLSSECYLPLAAGWCVETGRLRIRALETDADWFGVTYREDREEAAARLAALAAAGVYPPRLWPEGRV